MLSSGDVPGDFTKLGQSKLGQSLYEVYLLWTLYTSFTLNVKIVSVRKPLPKIQTKKQTQHQGTFSFGFNCDFRFPSMSLSFLLLRKLPMSTNRLYVYISSKKFNHTKSEHILRERLPASCLYSQWLTPMKARSGSSSYKLKKKNSLSILTDPSLVP